MSTRKGAPDAITVAVAAVLHEAVRDAHRQYPTLKAFKSALRERAGVSADTVERILSAQTSIRVDYLFHAAALLGVRGSDVLAEAEVRVESGWVPESHGGATAPAKSSRRVDEMASRSGEQTESLRALVGNLGVDLQDGSTGSASSREGGSPAGDLPTIEGRNRRRI